MIFSFFFVLTCCLPAGIPVGSSGSQFSFCFLLKNTKHFLAKVFRIKKKHVLFLQSRNGEIKNKTVIHQSSMSLACESSSSKGALLQKVFINFLCLNILWKKRERLTQKFIDKSVFCKAWLLIYCFCYQLWKNNMWDTSCCYDQSINQQIILLSTRIKLVAGTTCVPGIIVT